jgi:hypothetical protein
MAKTLTLAQTVSNIVKNVSKASSKDETRYNLCTVLVEHGEKGNLVFVATNGHFLIKFDSGVAVADKVTEAMPGRVVHTPGYALAPGLYLPKTLMAKIAAGIPPEEIKPETDRGQFPDYRQVIPKDRQTKEDTSGHQVVEGVAFAVNAAYLATVAEALAGLVQGDRMCSIKVIPAVDSRSPIKMTAVSPEHGEALGILMPMRL